MTATEELKKAIELVEQAADILQKSQMAFDFSMGAPHHVAYTRTNASGTVSNISAKGAPKVEIKRVSSNELNVSQRHVSYDLHVDGQYHATHNDINDAMDHKALIDGVHKVGNDLLNNPMLAEHHDNIKRKLEGLKANPDAKSAAQVAGDLKLIAEKAKPATTTMTEADAGTHLKNVANANDIRMYRKAAKLHSTSAPNSDSQAPPQADSRQKQYDHPNVAGRISHHKIVGDGGRGEKAGDGNPLHHATTTIGFAGTDYHPIGKTGNSMHDDTPVEAFESKDGHRIWADAKGRVHADGKSEVKGLRDKYEKHKKAK